MPHVVVKCYPGRTEEQKQRCADKIAQDLVEIMGCPESSVSVVIKEIPKEEWKEKVWDVDIIPNEKDMYKKPGYTCD